MQNPVADQVIKTLKEANNVLVTVRNSPSVDELAAAIALTLILNHLEKHALTVFSGRIPSTIEFLQPEMAIDSTTDSLRDFIIALDKSKADKLRYKVEDNVVRIFITPYKTALTENDLDFSQGEFNVDVVVALGVVQKEDFDQAVTMHGRILHDATVVTLTKQDVISELGAVNWHEQDASSVCEMISTISEALGAGAVDGQVATALLTGIVAETDRFKNIHTTPQVLSLSSKLMTAGANQQLIAEKLEEKDQDSRMMPLNTATGQDEDGTLQIDHDDEEVRNIHIDDSGNLELPSEPLQDELAVVVEETPPLPQTDAVSRSYIPSAEKPKMYAEDDSGTVNAQPLFGVPVENNEEPVQDYNLPPSQTPDRGVLLDPVQQQNSSELEDGTQAKDATNPQTPINDTQTLIDLEKSVDSQHLQGQPALDENNNVPNSTETTRVDDFFGTTRQTEGTDQSAGVPQPDQFTQDLAPSPEATSSVAGDGGISQPVEVQTVTQQTPQVISPGAPPEVPPPLTPQTQTNPQFFEADGNSSNPFLNPKD